MVNNGTLGSKGTIYKIVCVVLAVALMSGIALIGVQLNRQGAQLQTVENGMSAYELAVKYGYEGTVEEWLESLNGSSAYEVSVENGYTGTEAEWTSAVTAAAKQEPVGISSAKFSANGELILVLTDGSELNVGKAVGSSGQDGKNGQNGKDGADGKDGVGISGTAINEEGQLVITYSNGKQVNLDKLVGINGADGVGVKTAQINDAGELVLTYTNDQTANLGTVIGAAG